MLKFLQFTLMRAVMSILTLVIVSFIVFSMMELVPGNCAERYIAFKNTQGQNITVEDIRAEERRLGLDRPYLIRAFSWMGNVFFKGEFGDSCILRLVMGNNELWVPPFENYFGHRTGMLWAEYVDSNGAKGVKPPAYVMQLIADVNEFQSTSIGSPRFKELGRRMVKNMTENLLKIGVAQKPAPIYHRNVLKNFVEFKTHSYEYYRTYPYRGTQWYLDE